MFSVPDVGKLLLLPPAFELCAKNEHDTPQQPSQSSFSEQKRHIKSAIAQRALPVPSSVTQPSSGSKVITRYTPYSLHEQSPTLHGFATCTGYDQIVLQIFRTIATLNRVDWARGIPPATSVSCASQQVHSGTLVQHPCLCRYFC